MWDNPEVFFYNLKVVLKDLSTIESRNVDKIEFKLTLQWYVDIFRVRIKGVKKKSIKFVISKITLCLWWESRYIMKNKEDVKLISLRNNGD
jgi:hypothetical protein